MRLFKKIMLVLLVVFVAIQFIRPARNINGQAMPVAIAKQVSIPAAVQNILNRACNDCHSNNTRYPWYANVEPAGWLLAKHINQGKAELNFDEFGTYTKRRQLSKLKSIVSQVNDGEMPMQSYTWIHKDAKLSEAEKQAIADWADASASSISNGSGVK